MKEVGVKKKKRKQDKRKKIKGRGEMMGVRLENEEQK